MASQEQEWIINPFPPHNVPKSDIGNIITRLLQELDYPFRAEDCQLKSGGNNNIFIFCCVATGSTEALQPEPIWYVLRTAKYKSNNPLHVEENIMKMAAFHHRMEKKLGDTIGLPIPGVFAYDSTYTNAINCPYIIQHRVAGKDLMSHYASLKKTVDAVELRVRFAQEVALFIQCIENMPQQTVYGSVEVNSRMANRSRDPHLASNISLRVRPWSRENMTANTKIGHFLAEMLSKRENEIREPEEQMHHETLVYIAKRLNELDRTGERVQAAEPAVIWHPDLWPRNIMMETDGDTAKLTGVIDWDGVLVFPRIMTRRPPAFLWNQRRLTSHEKEVIKRSFDQRIEELLPGYCSDAYGAMPKIVRAVGIYAIKGLDWEYWTEMGVEQVKDAWLDLLGESMNRI